MSLGKRLHTVLTLSDHLAWESGAGTVMDRATFGPGQLICAPLGPLLKLGHHHNPVNGGWGGWGGGGWWWWQWRWRWCVYVCVIAPPSIVDTPSISPFSVHLLCHLSSLFNWPIEDVCLSHLQILGCWGCWTPGLGSHDF